jgi:hypothetical protein
MPLPFFFRMQKMRHEIQNFTAAIPNPSTVLLTSFTENVTYDIQRSRYDITTSSSALTLLTPYHLINDATTYFDSYDVFIPVHDTGCGLHNNTAALHRKLFH